MRFGLDNITAVYQESTERLFQIWLAKFDLGSTTVLLIAPSIDMVEVGDINDESLVAVLEESPTDTDLKDDHSANANGGVDINLDFVTPAPTRFFGGNIFHKVSNDEPAVKVENEDDW